jgi:transposase InsO family protein
MQLVAVDIMGPLLESKEGNSYILVVADYFTRWSEAFAIPNQEASTVAQLLTDKVFFRFSPPEQLHSDQGRQFESALIAEMCKILGIVKSRTTPYHPQSDGLVERFNRTLLDMLATAATDYPFDWQQHLRPLCMAYNTSVHTTTGYSPFYLMFGRQARMPIDIAYGQPQPSEDSSPAAYASELHHRLQDAYERVRVTLGHKLDLQKQIFVYNSSCQAKDAQ